MASKFSILACVVCIAVLPLCAEAEEVTATSLLKKGTVLTEADLNIEATDTEDVREIREAYVGLELRRTIYEGNIINRNHVSEPQLVKRNGPVTMIYRYGTMKLTAKGRSMGSGALGDHVTVLNVSSRKKVYGVVTGPERVEVTQ